MSWISTLATLLLAVLFSTAQPAFAALPEAARSATWIRLQSPHFTCYTNADQKTVSRLLRNLERLREVITATAQTPRNPGATPSYILVFEDRASFAPYNLRRGAPPIGYFSGGGSVGYLALALADNVEARRVIYHEFIHSHLFSTLPGVPLWLNEGLAEFYSTFESSGLTAEIGHPIDAHVQRLQAGSLFPLEILLAVDTSDPHYTHGMLQATYYAESWALTHMLAGPTGDGARFARLLAGIAQGEDPAATLGEVYGPSANSRLEEELIEQIRLGEFPFEKYRFSRNYEDLPVQAYSVHRKEILRRLGDLQVRLGSFLAAEAREHYLTALGLDAAYAPAVLGLATSYEMEGRQALADSLRAVAEKLRGGGE